MQNIWAVQTPGLTGPEPDWSFPVERVSGAMGAVVSGIDLRSITDHQFGELQAVLDRHHAVMVRGQSADMTVEEYSRFGSRFGDLAVDPFVEPVDDNFPEVMCLVREADDASYNFGGDWHADGTYLARPGAMTILWARELPPQGGDTIFSNLELAWESLSPAFRSMLEGRRCLHSATGFGKPVPITRKGDYAAVNFGRDIERIEHFHPIMRTHPRTGRRALFVNQAYSIQIEGCTPDESAGILSFLFDWMRSPAMTARMVWEPGTVMLWDNRNTVHYAVGDYNGHRREMYRLAVTGEVPA